MISRLLFAFMLITSAVHAAENKSRDLVGPGDDIVPLVIVGGEWQTTLVFNNTNELPVSFPIQFFREGQPWAVTVQGAGTFSTYNITLGARGSIRMVLQAQNSDTLVGFARLDVPCGFGDNETCGDVGVHAFLKNHNPARPQDFEVNYQPATILTFDDQHFVFDQTEFAQMVVNITNYCNYSFCDTQTVTLIVRDANGQQAYVDVVDVPPNSVRIVNFAQRSQATWNVSGMLHVTGGDDIVLSGHRINPTGSFTPLMSFDYD